MKVNFIENALIVTIIELSRHELAYDARHAQTSPYSVDTTSWSCEPPSSFPP
jgi:hypothetical protein